MTSFTPCPKVKFPLVQPLYHETYLQAKARQRYTLDHWRRIANAKTMIDNTPPRTVMCLRTKLKKLMDEGERLAIVEQSNKFLLQMIIRVMKGSGTVDHFHKRKFAHSHSLRQTMRKMFAKKTNEANQCLLKRLLNSRTSYDHIQQELDYQRAIRSRRGRAYVFKCWNELAAERRDMLIQGKPLIAWVDELNLEEMRAKMAEHHWRCYPEEYPPIVPKPVPRLSRSPRDAEPVDHQRCFTPFPILPPIPRRLKSPEGDVMVTETKTLRLRNEENKRKIEALKPPPAFTSRGSPSPKSHKGKGDGGGYSNVNQSAIARSTRSMLDFLVQSPYSYSVLQDLMIPSGLATLTLTKRGEGRRESNETRQGHTKAACTSQKDASGRQHDRQRLTKNTKKDNTNTNTTTTTTTVNNNASFTQEREPPEKSPAQRGNTSSATRTKHDKKKNAINAEHKENNDVDPDKTIKNVGNAEKEKELSVTNNGKEPKACERKNLRATPGCKKEMSEKKKTTRGDAKKHQQQREKNPRRKFVFMAPPKWLNRSDDWKRIGTGRSHSLRRRSVARDSKSAAKTSEKIVSTAVGQPSTTKRNKTEASRNSSDQTKRSQKAQVQQVQDKAANLDDLGTVEQLPDVCTSVADRQNGSGETVEQSERAVAPKSSTKEDFAKPASLKEVSPGQYSPRVDSPRRESSQQDSPRLPSSKQHSPRTVPLLSVSPRAACSRRDSTGTLSTQRDSSESKSPSSQVMLSPETPTFLTGLKSTPQTKSAEKDICWVMEPSQDGCCGQTSSPESSSRRSSSSEDGTLIPRVAQDESFKLSSSAVEQGDWSPGMASSQKDESERSAPSDTEPIRLNSPQKCGYPVETSSNETESAIGYPRSGCKSAISSTESESEGKSDSKSTSDTQDTVILGGIGAKTDDPETRDIPDVAEEEGDTTDDADDLPSSDTDVEEESTDSFRPVSLQELSSSSDDDTSERRYFEP